MPNKDFEDWVKKVIQELLSLRENNGAMAHLRRGLCTETEFRAYSHAANWCDLTDDRKRAIVLCVAGSFATHPAHSPDAGCFGSSLRKLACSRSEGSDYKERLKRFSPRFSRLLNCTHVSEVCTQIPSQIRALKAQGVPVDYACLLKDLCYWGVNKKTSRNRTKLSWAEAYWRS